MAENKNSFVLYTDQIHLFEHLTNDEAGKLIKHIFLYVNDQNPETEDRFVKLAFEPIKHQLKRDLKKWEGYIEKQRVNGQKGGRPKEIQKTQAFNNEPKKADNVTVTVNDTVTVNVNDTVKEKIDSRKLKFASTLEPFLELYGRDLLNNFFKYWTEPNKSNTKFRQELEKTWSLERRLETWASREKNFNKQDGNKNPIDGTLLAYNQALEKLNNGTNHN